MASSFNSIRFQHEVSRMREQIETIKRNFWFMLLLLKFKASYILPNLWLVKQKSCASIKLDKNLLELCVPFINRKDLDILTNSNEIELR